MIEILFYPAFLIFLLILSLIFIPKQDYKEYLIYGFLGGGMGDMVVVGIFQNLLHIIRFKNTGIFNVLGEHFLSPPCWTFTVMLFLYFLPKQKLFQYLYILTFAGYSVGFGIVVHNVGLFEYRPWFYPVCSYLTFLGWWVFNTWLFVKTSPLAGSVRDRCR